jgi:hypothetical protein
MTRFAAPGSVLAKLAAVKESAGTRDPHATVRRARGARLRSVRWPGQGRMVRAVMRPSAANWKWNLRVTGLPGKSPEMSTAASCPVLAVLTSWTV